MSRGRILAGASLAVLAGVLFLRPFVSSASSPGFNATFFGAVLAACILMACALLLGLRGGGGTLPADLMAYLFLAILCAGFLRSPDRAGAIDSFYPMAAALLGYLLASRLGSEERTANVLLATLSAALVLVAVWGIYQYYHGLEALREQAASEGWALDELMRAQLRMHRVYAGFVSPNALAGFIVLLCPPMFCLILKAPRSYLVCFLQVTAVGCVIGALRMQSMWLLILSFAYASAVFVTRRRISLGGLRIAGLLPVGLVLACLLFTGSKSGYVIFAASSFLILTRVVEKRRLLLCLVAVAIVGLLFYAAYGTDLGRRLATTAGVRVDYWRGAVGVIKEYPLCGSGLGSFWCEYQQHMLPGAHLVAHAHNSYLEIWAELGVPGLLLFAALLGFSIVRGLRGGAGLMEAGAATGLLAFALHNVVDYDLYVPEVSLAAFVIAGLLYSGVAGRGSRLRDWVFLCVCGGLLLWLGPRFMADQAAPELEWKMREALGSADNEAARSIIPPARRAGPRRARLRVMIGDFFLGEGDAARAGEEYRAAVDANPRWSRPHRRLAGVYAQGGDADGALNAARRAAELSPVSAGVRVELGDLLGALGRHDEAVAEYRKALDLQRAGVERDAIDRRATLEKNRAFLRAIEERLAGSGREG